MVLGLIDFLLGGKKKTQVPKTAQVSSPVSGGSNQVSMSQNAVNVPDGTSVPTANAGGSPQGDLQFQDSTGSTENTGVDAAKASTFSSQGKKSVADILTRMNTQLKELNESVVGMSSEMKDLQNNVSTIDHRVSELENENKITSERLVEIDENMSKFLSLYEIVNNQYNPFITMEEPKKQIKEIVVGADGSSFGSEDSNESLSEKIKKLDSSATGGEKTIKLSKDELESSLLELDTLNLDEAAADAVPLTHLKSNTNSLVVILSWLEYLVKRAGIEETKNTLRYYTETLKWITPEVYFELDKFLRGMDDIIQTDKKGSKLNVRDHIVSLYFISKLNEKKLDDKLTKAVLQIIKEK